ncbi:MAG: DUF1573 domain-containing protein [Bacteroidota bacterium]
MKQIKMIAIIAIASVSFMSFTVGKKQSTADFAYNIAKINWIKESHDFGEIAQAKPVTVEFAFTNTGDEPLLIADVVPSCGCTASDYSKEPIAPGKLSKIKITYNAASVGSFAKTITVNFQDAGLKKVLNIKGTVK